MQTITLAKKTLAAIASAIEADQGASYRVNLGKVIPHIGDAYRGAEGEGFRSHLGASLLGKACARDLWYGFRWFKAKAWDARMLRLFNRGHLEEARFIALLLTIGVQVYQQDENGKQFRISELGGHLGGSGDGVAIGIPDVTLGQPCLTEFKTHGDKSFQKLKKEGVRSAKFEHFVQMQIYMRKMGIPVALYLAVNKNDDELHGEIVHLESTVADVHIERGKTIILSQYPPKRLSESPGWFECKWCDHHGVCHKGEAPAKNCRTCKWSTARENGQWDCRRHQNVLTKADQLAGCSAHEYLA